MALIRLITLPYEVLSAIVSNVDFDDIANLARSCRFFQYLHTDERSCKLFLQVRDRNVLAICPRVQSDIRILAADNNLRQKFLSQRKPALRIQQDTAMPPPSDVPQRDVRPLSRHNRTSLPLLQSEIYTYIVTGFYVTLLMTA